MYSKIIVVVLSTDADHNENTKSGDPSLFGTEFAVYIGGGAIVLILLIVIIVVVVMKRKNKKNVENDEAAISFDIEMENEQSPYGPIGTPPAVTPSTSKARYILVLFMFT